MKYNVYFAAPLFGLTERRTNREIAQGVMQLQSEVDVILPQDFKYHGKFNDVRTFSTIFKTCVKGVDDADIVVALLDGADSDSGTCFEVGYAFAKRIPIIGIRTDYRANQERGLNLMLSQSCAVLIHRPAFDENIEALTRDIVRALRRVLNLSARQSQNVTAEIAGPVRRPAKQVGI